MYNFPEVLTASNIRALSDPVYTVLQPGRQPTYVYLVPPPPPVPSKDTIARLHSAVGAMNSGVLQNVRESVVRRANVLK
jgi:hypothetical protein